MKGIKKNKYRSIIEMHKEYIKDIIIKFELNLFYFIKFILFLDKIKIMVDKLTIITINIL
jgi:hypothetical protein